MLYLNLRSTVRQSMQLNPQILLLFIFLFMFETKGSQSLRGFAVCLFNDTKKSDFLLNRQRSELS